MGNQVHGANRPPQQTAPGAPTRKGTITGGGLPATAHRGTATQNKVNPGPPRPTPYGVPAKKGYTGGGSVPARLKPVVFPNRRGDD